MPTIHNNPPSKTWRDVLPAIPLAPNVGVLDEQGYRCTVVEVNPVTGDCLVAYRATTSPTGGVPTRWVHWKLLRVDLDDPQGFGYALRWFLIEQQDKGGFWVDPDVTIDEGVLHRWCTGTTTDDDRLVLATAIAEVTRG